MLELLSWSSSSMVDAAERSRSKAEKDDGAARCAAVASSSRAADAGCFRSPLQGAGGGGVDGPPEVSLSEDAEGLVGRGKVSELILVE